MEPQQSKDQAQTLWTIDPKHSVVQFRIKNLFFFTVAGRFADLAGTITLDEADLRRSAVEFTVKAASVETGNRRRDDHLRSADFLEAEKYPAIRFQSTSVEKGRDRDTLRVTGTLTIKGSSREVVLDVTALDRSRSPQGEEVIYYTALAEVDRFDFGIDYGRGLIGSTLKITVQIQALKRGG